MDFDERLQRTFAAMSERLHQEIATQLKTATAELSDAARTERDGALLTVAREAQAAAERDAAGRLAERVALAEAVTSREAAAAQRVLAAVRAMDGSRSL